MPITALPTPPDRNDPDNFRTAADAFMAALPTFATEANALAADVNDLKDDAEAAASAAADAQSDAETAAAAAAASALTAVNAPGTSATSTTSNSVGTGSKSWTIQTGKNFVPGHAITAARTSDPSGQRMGGTVTAYNSGTGLFSAEIGFAVGSGTYTDWTISLGATVPAVASAVGSSVCHNGGFRVNQRGVSGTVSLSAGAYGHDRWKAGASGCTYTFATSAGVTTLTITAGSLLQVVDGTDLRTGTYTLSWTGTAQGKIGGGSYSASGVNGSVTGGSNINIEFGTGTLANVQFEPGPSPTAFNVVSLAEEMLICQRYLPVTDAIHLSGQAYGSGAAYFHCDFRVPARAAPTGLLLTGALSSYSVTNATFGYTAMTGGAISFGSAAVGGGSFTAVPTSSPFTAGDSTSLQLSGGAKILWTGAEL